MARRSLFTSFKALTLATIIATAAVAYAAGKETIQLPYDAKVGGAVLPAGTYQLHWDDAGKVEFLKGKKVVASTSATVSKSSQPVRATSVSAGKGKDGSRVIREIDVKKQNVTLRFAEESPAVTAAK